MSREQRHSFRTKREDRKVDRLIKFIQAQSPLRFTVKNKSANAVGSVHLGKSKSQDRKPVINEAIQAYL